MHPFVTGDVLCGLVAKFTFKYTGVKEKQSVGVDQTYGSLWVGIGGTGFIKRGVCGRNTNLNIIYDLS